MSVIRRRAIRTAGYLAVAGALLGLPSLAVAEETFVLKQTITITGAGTAFTGSPFSISGSFQSNLQSQNVASGTSGTIVLDPGTYGNALLMLKCPEEVTGYREVRYPKMDRARQRVAKRGSR